MFLCCQQCRLRPHLCRNARVPATRATLMSMKRKPCAYRRQKSVPGSLPNSRLGGTQERKYPGSRRLGEAVELLHTFFALGSEKQEPSALPWPCTPPMGEGREPTDQGTQPKAMMSTAPFTQVFFFFFTDKLALGQASAATTCVCSLDYLSALLASCPLTTPRPPLPSLALPGMHVGLCPVGCAPLPSLFFRFSSFHSLSALRAAPGTKASDIG